VRIAGYEILKTTKLHAEIGRKVGIEISKRSTSTLSNPAAWLLNLFGGTTTSGVAVNSNTALQVSTVYGCVEEIAKGVANMPVMVYKGEELVTDDLTLLLKRPNLYMSGYDFFHFAAAVRALKGNFYAYIVRDAAYRPVEIHPIPTDNVTPWFKNGQLFYQVTATSVPYFELNVPNIVPARDMIHFKGLSAGDPLKGLNPVALHAETIGVSLSATKHQGRAQKDGILKFLVKSESKLSPDQAKIAKDSLNDIIYNGDNIAVLPSGASLEKIQLTPDELKLLEVLKLTKTQICEIFGVAEAQLAGSVSEQDYIYFHQSTLTGYTEPMTQELEFKLLSEKDKYTHRIVFNFDSLLRATADKRAEVYGKNILNGVMTSNEARKKENLKPLLDGNVQYMNAQVIPANKMEDYWAAKIIQLENSADKNNNPDGNNNNNTQ
jgi:HK97 family phage portal protein